MTTVWVKLPEMPLMRIEKVPGAAFFLADKVSVLVFVVLPGLKDAVTPRGRPEADKLTLPVKPFCVVTVIVDVILPPRARLNEFGEAARAKFGGGATVRETVVLCNNAPDVAVIVIVKVPSVAVLLAVSVSVLALVVLLGLNDAVTPLGRPEAEKLTRPLNPLSGLTLMALVPFPP
jgi:hypothetical protein